MNNDKILLYIICIIVFLILISKELHDFYCSNFCKKNKNVIDTNTNINNDTNTNTNKIILI
jgi:hypothetical protein